jgi:hypothetical protein
MATPHLALASACLLLACSRPTSAFAVAPSQAAPQSVEAPPASPAFPPGLAVTFLTHAKAPGAVLRLDPEGHAWLGVGGAFVPLKRSPDDVVAGAFKLEGAPEVGAFAVLDDAVVLAVVGTELRRVTRHGFQVLGPLPSSNMQLAAATRDKAWLFGGKDPVDRHLVLVGKDGEAEHWLSLPGPVGAVAGTPDRVIVATEGSILQAERGGRATLLFDSPSPVRALAVTGDGDVFFVTAGGLFYLAAGGTLLHVMREAPIAVHAHEDDLYLDLGAAGVVRGSPLASFKALARTGGGP